jgi:hypothetical protein
MADANAVLARFAPQVRRVLRKIQGDFELSDSVMDDWRQEANLYVLCYAGLVPWPTANGRHFGLLSVWEQGHITEVANMLSTQLRLDLSESIGRAIRKEPAISDQTLDDLAESGKEPSEPSYERESHNDMDESRYIRRYPLFARNVLDGVTQPILAELMGVSLPTIERRIRGEKRSFLASQLRRRGIVVEGDESMAELEEAYQYSLVERG